MKHIFIVNPKSGKGNAQKKLISKIQKRGLDLYLTKNFGDGEEYIKEICNANPSENFRFYACGGDGTLNEIVNGIFGLKNAEAAALPVGSGNDFIKSFGISLKNFRDIDKQLSGKAVTIDVIKYQDIAENSEARYAANMFNIGFDCNVVAKMADVKKLPFITGSFAYILSILITLIKKDGANLIIDFEDGTNYCGNVLLTAIGNGAFCGGGLKGLPNAKVDDGLMDICIVKDVSRRLLMSLLPKYAKGTYLSDKRVKEFVIYKKCKSFTIKSPAEVWNLCVDGEIGTAAEIKFEIVPLSVKFSLPV